MGGRVRVQHLCLLQAVRKGPFNLLSKTLCSFEVSTSPRLANKPLPTSHEWRCTISDPLVTAVLPASISPAQATCASQKGLSDLRVHVPLSKTTRARHSSRGNSLHLSSEVQMSFPSLSFMFWRNSSKLCSRFLITIPMKVV